MTTPFDTVFNTWYKATTTTPFGTVLDIRYKASLREGVDLPSQVRLQVEKGEHRHSNYMHELLLLLLQCASYTWYEVPTMYV